MRRTWVDIVDVGYRLWFQWHVLDKYANKDLDRYLSLHPSLRLISPDTFARPLHVCVFGGDGTVVWVLNALDHHKGIQVSY